MIDINKEFDAAEIHTIEELIRQIRSERHRFYHSYDHHIEPLLNQSNNKEEYLLALYHDAIYDPYSKTNEEDSANLWLDRQKIFSLTEESKQRIYEAILETRTHTSHSSDLSLTFIKRDLSGFNQPFSQVLRDYKLIQKEYQYVDYNLFKEGRLSFLNTFRDNPYITETARVNIGYQIGYIKQETPSIAVYPGTFNPFTRGHLDILEKSEEIFDKTIILYSNNPDKPSREIKPPIELRYRQVEYTELPLITYIKSKPYPLTIIRGLRNTTDFSAEKNYTRWLREIEPSTRILNIFSDSKLEHISSSAIRELSKLHPELADKYMVK